MSKWQALVDQVRLRSEQLLEAQLWMPADSIADHLQPEPRHRVVVALGAAVLGGELTDARSSPSLWIWTQASRK